MISEIITLPPLFGSRRGGRIQPTWPRDSQVDGVVESGPREDKEHLLVPLGAAWRRLETRGQNILSQRTFIHDFAKSIGDLNCSITSDKVIHDCYQLSPLSEVLERSTEQG